MHRLAPLRRVVALDLPGHGRSSGQTQTIDDWVQAIGGTAAALCLGRSVLVGHSLGGLAAIATALAFPDKVAGLVLVTTAARLAVSSRLLDRIANDWVHFPDTIREMAHSPDTPPDVRRRSTALALGAAQEQTLADFAMVAHVDLRSRLADVTCPTLVIAGRDDLMVPVKWSAALAEEIPGARLEILPSGHFPMHEQPDGFANALRTFLTA